MTRIAAADIKELKLDDAKLKTLDAYWLKFIATEQPDGTFADTYQCRPIVQADIDARENNANSFWEMSDGSRKPQKGQNRYRLTETTTFRDIENAARESFVAQEFNIDGDGNQASDGDLHDTLLIGRDFFFDVWSEEEGEQDNPEKTTMGVHVICTHPAFWILRIFDETNKDELQATFEYSPLAGFLQTLATSACDNLEELRQCGLNNKASKALGYGNKETILDTPVLQHIADIQASIKLADI
jgi:hypothetical protein